MPPIIYLIIQTLLCWSLVYFLYHQKYRFTLLPLYAFIGVLTVLTHNVTDLGYAVIFHEWYLLIASVSFFTSLMMSVMMLYLIEGPKAARLALIVILFTSFFYIGVVALLTNQVDTTQWITITPQRLQYYFWSIAAIVIDVMFLAMIWEFLAKISKLPLVVRIAITIFGTFSLDSLIFLTGAYGMDPAYLTMLRGSLGVRAVLAIISTPILYYYLHKEHYSEADRKKPKQIWEILNFRSDLELTIDTLKLTILRENRLIQELAQFQRAVKAASDQIVITDSNGIVLHGNPAMQRITGYSEDEVIGKKAGLLWGNMMPKTFYETLWRTIKKDKKAFIGELTNKRKDGTPYEASLKISPVLDNHGDVQFFVAIERDITREKQLDRMKDEFLSIASHELRTPLTAIDGLVAMIREGEYGKITEELRQPLEDINTASERLIHLVNDLLSVSRMEAGRLKYTITQFDLQSAIQETVGLLQTVAKEKGVSLQIHNIPSIMVQADCDKVKQVLNNLIGNSIKFTDHGSITLSAKIQGDLAIIYIQDTGIGMKQDEQIKLFNKFQQLDSGKGRPAGTGLGLYISKELCRKMGGDLILLQSELGKGSTFTFSVPIPGSPAASAAEKIIAEESQSVPDQKSDTIRSSKV